MLAHLLLGLPAKARELHIGESHALHGAQRFGIDVRQGRELSLRVDHFAHLVQEPRVDHGNRVDLRDGHPGDEGALDLEDPLRRRGRHCGTQGVQRIVRYAIVRRAVADDPAHTPAFEGAQSLLQRFLEGSTDGHRLTHRLHLRGEDWTRQRELLERKAWTLHHHIVEHRLERGRRRLCDIVGEFVEPVAHCELRADARDRKTGGLRGERRAARHTRVHLDDDHIAVRRVHRELDIAPAGVDPDLANHLYRGVTHRLILAVGQRHRRCHGDRIARVHTHRIDILDRTDNHHVVGMITHDFELILFPAE